MKNEFIVTKKVYKRWGYEGMLMPKRLIFSIFWCIFCISFIALGTYYAIKHADLICIAYFLLAVFCLINAFIRDLVANSRQYNILAKTYGQENWVRAISFEEDGIHVNEGNLTLHYAYSDVQQLKENGNKLNLVLKNKLILRFYKDTFVDVNWDIVETYLKGKGILF